MDNWDEMVKFLAATFLLIGIGTFIGYFGGQSSVANDCDLLGKFSHNGHVYVCSAVGKSSEHGK